LSGSLRAALLLMSHPALSYPLHEQQVATSLHDQVQIALAIADTTLLTSLLVNCTPPIAPRHRIGTMIDSQIGVPLEAKKAVDGVLHFEEIHCVLADAPPNLEKAGSSETWNPWNGNHREYAKLTRCESETHVLGQNISQGQAASLLAHAGFSGKQVEEILRLPSEGHHKSWWYMLGDEGGFTIPFHRLIRTLRYPDGRLTIQYKDYFAQDKPPCFKSQDHKVLVEIQTERHSFHKTLEKINYSRQRLGIHKAIVISDRLSELEARGLISQGISIYSASDLLLPAQADCTTCATKGCPLNGVTNSPVIMCHQFCVEAESDR
jgi:hypothetical protein